MFALVFHLSISSQLGVLVWHPINMIVTNVIASGRLVVNLCALNCCMQTTNLPSRHSFSSNQGHEDILLHLLHSISSLHHAFYVQ